MEAGESADPLVGATIGPCRIEERLAAGGMGIVYRARHQASDQDVAVKILAPSLASDNEYVTRFFREAGAAGQIDHRNIVRVIDVGREEDKYYLVMEYVPGETLDKVIEREKRLSLERGTRIVRELASGLAAAHRRGIIHRDVKPGNILISRDGRPHLTDFGLAREVSARKGLTIEGTFLGTPEFASPEQVEGKTLDPRSDLYSLGVTYYQLLSGKLPFDGESPMEIAIRRTREPARPLEHAFPAADPRACTVTARLLARNPNQRYDTAQDLLKDLDAILGNRRLDSAVPERAKTARPTGPQKNPVRSRRQLRSWLHGGLLAVAAILAFLSGGLAARGGAWAEGDGDFSLRLWLLCGGVVAAAAAVLAHWREFAWSGRTILLALLCFAVVAASLGAGVWIDRAEGQGRGAIMANTVGALFGHLDDPVNLLGLGLLLLFLAVLTAMSPKYEGWFALAARLMMVAGFLLLYLFGCGDRGIMAAPANFLVNPELAIPLATATLLALVFSVILVTGADFGPRSRIFGIILAAGTATGVFAFAVLVGQPREPGWFGLLGGPFADLGRAFPRAGTLLIVAGAVAAIERSVITAGIQKVDRFYRRR